MTIRKSVAATSDSSHNTHDVMYGLVGVSSVLVLGAIVCAAVKVKRRNGSRNGAGWVRSTAALSKVITCYIFL